MSEKSQETTMRRLAGLLSHDLDYIAGERECGPNGDKKIFLNLGKVFLRALARDLGLRDARITSNSRGIASSGSCSLIGMWETSGIYIALGQKFSCREYVLLYRTVRNLQDYSGGHNHFLTLDNLRKMSYTALLEQLDVLRKESIIRGRCNRAA